MVDGELTARRAGQKKNAGSTSILRSPALDPSAEQLTLGEALKKIPAGVAQEAPTGIRMERGRQVASRPCVSTGSANTHGDFSCRSRAARDSKHRGARERP